jgi:hypothetical protein
MFPTMGGESAFLSDSDILSVQLWLGSAAIAFAGIAITAAGFNNRLFVRAMFGLFVLSALVAVLWRRVIAFLPEHFDNRISFIANSKVAWFVSFILGIGVMLIISKSRRSTPKPQPKELRTVLRLRFTGELEQPHEVIKENISSWFAYWSPGGECSDQHGNVLFSVPSSWAIFIEFERPTAYRQLIVSFAGGRPHSYEVRQTRTTTAVITLSGGMPSCEMEAITRA